MNKLPEKLTMLRKYRNLSQGDLAQRLHVPVTEYMQWENGNTICSIEMLKNMSDIFGVSLDDLIDNTKTIVIPEPRIEQSVNIPFHGGQDINATQVYGDGLEDTMQATQQFSSFQDERNDVDDAGKTRVMDTTSINTSKQTSEDDEEEEEVKPKPKKKKKPTNDKKKKRTIMIISAVALVVILIAVGILLLTNVSSKLSVGSENRIAVGDTYSLYVKNDGTVEKYGSFNSSTSFTNAVQVSAFDDHAVALLSNGTVVSSDGNSDVSSWKDIQYIAAGKDHTVGVTSEGKVECAGNDNACKVSEWSNISSVYAGDGFTIGLTNDGAVKASGNNTEAVANQSNVRHISVSDNMIVVTKKDGKVTVYPIGSSDTNTTGSWTDIQSTAAGNNLVVGLKKDGTVNISYSDEEVVNKVTAWKNIKYIAANGSTVVGIDSSGKMHGAGDNSYNQYVDTTEDKEETTDQLDEVKNIQVSATTANVVIKWDVVDNASYYEVTVNTTPETSTKTSSNSTSIPSSSLVDGTDYTVTVTAKSDDENVKESSASYTFTYTAKTVQLSTPSGITATTTDAGWLIDWTAVEHATSYKVSIDGGQEFEVDTNSYTDTGMETEGNHTVSIKACSTDTTYTESEAGTANLQYTTQSVRVNLVYLDSYNTWKGDTTVMAKVGLNYTWKDLDALAGNYAASQGWTLNEGSAHIYSSTSSINITIADSDTPVEGQ